MQKNTCIISMCSYFTENYQQSDANGCRGCALHSLLKLKLLTVLIKRPNKWVSCYNLHQVFFRTSTEEAHSLKTPGLVSWLAQLVSFNFVSRVCPIVSYNLLLKKQKEYMLLLFLDYKVLKKVLQIVAHHNLSLSNARVPKTALLVKVVLLSFYTSTAAFTGVKSLLQLSSRLSVLPAPCLTLRSITSVIRLT